MSDEMMQAIRAHTYGGPEVLVLEWVPRPEPQAGQVLVRVRAAGVDPVDWKFRAGMMKNWAPLTFPWTPGAEGAGTVEQVGDGVDAFSAGQAVYGAIQGAYAEYAVAAVGDLQPKPSPLTFEQAAAVPIGGLTAWKMVEDTGVRAGQRVLVQGAAGGVGLFAVQLAVVKGAQVIGTSSAGNLDFVRELGAVEAIDYNALPFESVVHDVDVVLDTVGGDVTERSLHVLKPDGVLATIAGQITPEMGQAHGVRVIRSGRASADRLRDLSELLEGRQITPVVQAVYPLSQAGQAQAQSESRHGRGRIVLEIG